MDADKQASALVSGLARRLFFNDEAITDEIMAEKLFGGDTDAFETSKARVTKVLTAVAAADYEAAQAERYLGAQASKKGGVTEAEVQAIVKYWKKERTNIHDQLVKKSSWNDTLTGSSWRLDVLAKTQHIEELSEPSAIMELKVDKAEGAGADVIRFELSAGQVAEMVSEVDKIEAQIQALTA
mmetsp:Transcript_115334/g.162143  ORF Transcript_115334/g.162143 Transcript_115334/m.162143 type:complete len:183 (+) Transcript_115334:119-667(+)